MIKTHADDPINPWITQDRDDNGGTVPGLTKREYFAALAMQGNVSNPELIHIKNKVFALLAVEQADALIEELNKENNE